MRSALSLLALLLTPVASVAALPAWEPVSTEVAPLSFVSDTTPRSYNLSLAFPALPDWDSLAVKVYFSSAVFEPLTDGSFSTGYDVFGPPSGNVLPQTNTHFDSNRPGEALDGYEVQMILNSPTALAEGALVLTMSLVVKPNLAPQLLGARQIITDIEYSTFSQEFEDGIRDTLVINANVSAVPEPRTWAAMLAGLALLGGMAMRAGSKRRCIGV